MKKVDNKYCMVDNRIIRVDKMRVLISLFILIFTPPHFSLLAQISVSDRYHSRFLNDANELPYRNVDGIFQDDKGFVWISFFGAGISRFDGSRFVNFTKQSSTPISNNYVTEACQDEFDRVWVASAMGLDIINKNRLDSYPTPREIRRSTRNRFCNYVMCDSKGRIWYNVADVIYRVSFNEDGSFSCLDSLKCSKSGGDLRLTIRDIDEDGAPYTSIDGQIVKVSGAKGSGELNYSFKIAGLNIGPNNKATDILRNGSDIWVATTKGLYRHNQMLGSNEYYLEDDYVTSLVLSDERTIIAGTLDGINAFDSNNNSFERFRSEDDLFGNSLISDNIIRSLSMIGDQLWIGTEQEGITILEKKRLSITNFNLKRTPITATCVDDNGQCWAGSSADGLYLLSNDDYSWSRFDYKDGLSRNSIRALCCDDSDNLWVGTTSGSLNKVNINTHRIIQIVPDGSPFAVNIDNINHLIYDEINDYLWITARTGLFYYDIVQNSLREFKNDYRLCFGACIDKDYRLWFVHSNGITSIDLHNMEANNFNGYGFCHTLCLDSDNNLWVGTSEEGILKLSIHSLAPIVVQRYSTDNGLSDNKIMSLVNNGGYIWAASERGLSRINIISGVVESYTINDGLSSEIFNINAVCKGDNEEMYFGHHKGLSILWSNYIPQHNETPIHLAFTRALIGQTEVNLAYNNELSFHEREELVAFEFADFSYHQNNNIRYEYRLYPLDKQWKRLAKNERYIRWNGVANGRHKLQIRAVDAAGNLIPSGESELSLTVQPYFFRTSGFTFFFILVLICLFLGVYKWKTKSIRQRQEQAEREAELKDQQLKEQSHQLELQTEMVNSQDEVIIKQNEQIAGQKIIINTEPNKNVQFAKLITDKLRLMYKDSELNIDMLCKEMGMSRTVLNTKVQEAFGLPIGQFIRKYRLSVAKEIIRNRNVNGMNVSEIAYEVGFNDPKYFTRCFSREFGIAPSAMMEKYNT